MAEKTTVARPYAKAAFQEAQGDKRLGAWSETLRAAATAVRDPRVHELLGNPSVNGEELAQFVMAVTGPALDEHGQIMRFTTAYDSSLIDDPTYQAPDDDRSDADQPQSYQIYPTVKADAGN